jgi:hypothetical protein
MKDMKLKYPVLSDVSHYMSELSHYYFIFIAIVAAISFFNPVVGAVAAIVLLTTSIWVLVDSCGGFFHSINFLLNKNDNMDKKDDYFNNTLHTCNLVWCLFMFAVVVTSFIVPLHVVFIPILFISFGCAMWVYLLENLNNNNWNFNKCLNANSVSLAIGGVGAILFACFLGFGLPYAVGVIAISCYLLAAALKASAVIADKISVPERPEGQVYTPVKMHSGDLLHTNGKALSSFSELKAGEVAISSGLDIDKPISFSSFVSKSPKCQGGFKMLLMLASLFLFDNKDGAGVIKKQGKSLVCRSDIDGKYNDDNLKHLMAKAALEFELRPITLSGGDYDSQLIAIKAALKFGFIDIKTVKPVDKCAPNHEYDRVVYLLSELRQKYTGQKDFLEDIDSDDIVNVQAKLLASFANSLDATDKASFQNLISSEPDFMRKNHCK